MGYKQKPFVAWPNREWDLDFWAPSLSANKPTKSLTQ